MGVLFEKGVSHRSVGAGTAWRRLPWKRRSRPGTAGTMMSARVVSASAALLLAERLAARSEPRTASNTHVGPRTRVPTAR
eukprot:scaffold318862_cov35-Tisochrysis_lutea.AAC.2